MRQPRQSSLPARTQKGATLIIAMVMLIVIGLASAAVMRNTMNSELVANNARLRAQAYESAATGLRYCERQVSTIVQPPPAGAGAIVPAVILTIQAAPTGGVNPSWQTLSNWVGGTALATTVPAAVAGAAVARPPQCMAQNVTLPDGSNAILVTARGFSFDYDSDNAGHTTSGSSVWLQSTMLF